MHPNKVYIHSPNYMLDDYIFSIVQQYKVAFPLANN